MILAEFVVILAEFVVILDLICGNCPDRRKNCPYRGKIEGEQMAEGQDLPR